jgi:hypothetical protein
MTAPRPIDCDLHPTMPALSALMPYLDEMWRETVVRRGLDELNSPLTARADWRGGKGKLPGSRIARSRERRGR